MRVDIKSPYPNRLDCDKQMLKKVSVHLSSKSELKRRKVSSAALIALAVPVVLGAAMSRSPAADLNVTTYMYDNIQSGVNASETTLTPDNVKSGFGQVAACEIDGQAYAQPLVLANVTIAGQTHTVVYTATCHDSVYAFDADTGAPLWHDSFISPSAGDNISTVPNDVTRSGDINPEIGIVSTPVIDPKTGTLYVVAKTKETGRPDGKTHYVQKIHALDVATGAEKFSGPKVIADTSFDNDKYDYNLEANPQTPSVSGTAKDAIDGKVYVNALRNNQRCSLTLYNGVVYVAWSSHGDNQPYHGFLVGYDASTLAPVPGQVFCATPDGSEGGIWQSGAGPVIDPDGNLFVTIDNAGDSCNANVKPGNLGESFVKFNIKAGLSATADGFDFFAPHDAQGLAAGDSGVGSGGLLLCDVPGATPHLAIAGGKNGLIYVVNRDNMGHYDTATDHTVQLLEGQGNWMLSAPVFFNNCLFYNRSGEDIKCLPFSNGRFGAVMGTAQGTGGRGGGPVISANGTNNGLVWIIDNGGPASLIAYKADDLINGHSKVDALYKGRMPDGGIKFTHPVVVNGKVYACCASVKQGQVTAHLCIFGLNSANKSVANDAPAQPPAP